MNMSTDSYLAIGCFQAEYVRCIDDGDVRRWPEFFHEQCLYRITTADNHRRGLQAGIVYADSRGMLHDRVAALFEANIYERHAYRHLLGQPAVLGEEDGEILSETAFVVVRIMREGQSDLFASGRYIDRFRDDGDGLKLSSRVVVCDSGAFDTLLAVPL